MKYVYAQESPDLTSNGEELLCSDGLLPDPVTGLCSDGNLPPSQSSTPSESSQDMSQDMSQDTSQEIPQVPPAADQELPGGELPGGELPAISDEQNPGGVSPCLLYTSDAADD